MGATPNGRHACAPISHGANPDPGFTDAGAATALATAIASVQCIYGNTVPLQLELDPGFTRQQDAVENMVALIRTYCNDMGGTLMNIAACYNNMEQYDSAHVYNMKAIKVNPDDAVAYIDVGKYWLVNSRVFSDSVKHYQDIEDSEGAKRNIGLRDQMFDSSSVYFKRGLELDPENMDALTNFGIVSLIRGNYEDALGVFTKLSEIEPFVKEHWIDQGDCLIQLQKFEEAIAPFEKASELDPGDPKIWNVLHELYTSSGQTEKAKEAKAKAADLENL